MSLSKYKLITSESVSEGHPDKIADQISDAILDALISQDKRARVACECLVKTGMVIVAGEITTSEWVDIDKMARQTIKEIGYNHSDMGFDWESCAVLSAIGKQSADIAQGVDDLKSIGAGDQGIMYGYACNETDVYMPAPILYAHKLMQRQAELRKKNVLSWLRPDAKSQVTLQYKDNIPVGVDTVVLSTQHAPDILSNDLEEAVIEEIIKPVFPKTWLKDTKYFINPTGRFVVGGPLGDCGLTGRKLMVDTYGGLARHGGGSFSGKDPTKVDRSAAYYLRYIAKNLVAAGVADQCEIHLCYAIGIAKPLAVDVNTFNTGKISDDKIRDFIVDTFSFAPQDIIEQLNLLTPIYRQTASYGHFGREEPGFTWERLDQVERIKEALMN